MHDPIVQYLEQHGPCLTTDLANHLVKTRKIKPATARQQVHRMSPEIKRLAYITFPRNARFVYLVRDYGSPRFWNQLVQALEDTNSTYGAALAAIRARKGIVPQQHFEIVCGAPVKQKKHLSAERVLSNLVEAKLLELRQIDGLGECVMLPQGEGYVEFPAQVVRARLLAEAILITAITEWLRNIGIVSYGRVARRDKGPTPKISTTAWDIAGPSYLAGLLPAARKDVLKVNPAFFACDLLLGPVVASAVKPFVRKCMALRSLRGVGPCMQMFVADTYTAEAREILKRNGIIAATTRTLFGKDVAGGLRDLVGFFQVIASGSTLHIEQFDALLNRFNEFEGAALQLKGTLFEFLSEKLAKYEFRADHVYMNRIYRSPKDGSKKAEADVIAETGQNQLTFIECKSTSPYAFVPDDQFRRWLQHNVPVLYDYARHSPEWANRKIKFEFWASAPLSEDSLTLYNQARTTLNPNRYSIRVRQGSELFTLCEEMDDASVTRAFEKHFVRK